MHYLLETELSKLSNPSICLNMKDTWLHCDHTYLHTHRHRHQLDYWQWFNWFLRWTEQRVTTPSLPLLTPPPPASHALLCFRDCDLIMGEICCCRGWSPASWIIKGLFIVFLLVNDDTPTQPPTIMSALIMNEGGVGAQFGRGGWHGNKIPVGQKQRGRVRSS